MTGLTSDRRPVGSSSVERGEEKHIVRKQVLPTVHVIRTLKKRKSDRGRRGTKGELKGTMVHREHGRTQEDAKRKTRGYLGA